MLELDLNKIKCRISEGCFYAIGSCAGYLLVKRHGEDDEGIDFELKTRKMRNGKVSPGSTVLEFQVKSTVNWAEDENNISYACPSKNYNDLITRNIDKDVRIILILMCLPEQKEEWINSTLENIVFKKSTFWYSTDSEELLENEDSTKTIYIPKTNILTADTFKDVVNKFMLRKLQNG